MTTPTETKDNLRDLTRALGDQRKVIDECRASVVVEGTEVKVVNGGSAEDAARMIQTYRDAVAKGEEIKSLIGLEESALGIGTYLDAPRGGGDGGDADADGHQGERVESKSIGGMFLDSDVFAEMRDRGLTETPRPFQIKAANIGSYAIETKDVFTAAGGNFTGPAFGHRQQDGIIIPAYRTKRVRDLFPTQSTTANLIEYVRRTGYVNNARVVAERTAADGSAATGGPTDVFGLKPPSNLTYTPEQAPVRVIAHTIDVSKTVLDDEPRLRDTINGEMLYGLRLVEDAEVLWGDGSGAHVLGIMNVPGIQAYDGASGPATDEKSDEIRRALTLVSLAYYESTGCVVHPLDWEDIELEKDSQGRYLLVMNVTVGAEQRLWRQPVVDTPAMTAGRFLVGAFGLGAKLYDREQANIAISTETRDLFDRNAIAIRAEERIALEVARPEAFVAGTFA